MKFDRSPVTIQVSSQLVATRPASSYLAFAVLARLVVLLLVAAVVFFLADARVVDIPSDGSTRDCKCPLGEAQSASKGPGAAIACLGTPFLRPLDFSNKRLTLEEVFLKAVSSEGVGNSSEGVGSRE